MPIKIRCTCGNILLAPEERLGDTGKCPACGRAIVVELSEEPSEQHEIEVDGSKKKVKRKKRKSIIKTFLTLFIYFTFLCLTICIVLLHTVNPDKIASMKIGNKKLDTFVDDYKVPVLMIRALHKKTYARILKIFKKGKIQQKKQSNKPKTDLKKEDKTEEDKTEEKKPEEDKTEEKKTEEDKTEEDKIEEDKTKKK